MTPLIEILSNVERSGDFASLQNQVRSTAHELGYDRILMFSFSAARDDWLGGIYWAEGHWFNDGEAIDAETYVRHCPVTRHVFETDQPFFWTKEQTRRGQRYRFVTTPRGAGLHGLQVPVFGPNGLAGAVCFGGEKIDSTSRGRLILTQLGATAFVAARNLLEPTQKEGETPLSARELEVLRWVASGQRVAGVAETLGLSERTVENHLRRIRQRLQVKTTAQAIGAAMRSGALPS